MPRNRMISPEFWSDEEIGKWSFQARLFYIGLWNFADDEGRFKASNDLLKAQIFPYDNKKRVDVGRLKHEIGSKVQWYCINSCQYGYLCNFLKHQRIDKPSKSKLPSPEQGKIVDNSPNPQGTLPPNISKDNIREVNIISQIENLLTLFPINIQTNIKTYWERIRLKNKSKLITDGRRLTLLNELYNSFQRCNDIQLFNYALEAAISHDACVIGYINAVIKNKKTERPK